MLKEDNKTKVVSYVFLPEAYKTPKGFWRFEKHNYSIHRIILFAMDRVF